MVLFFTTLGVVLVGRVLAPSDLLQNADQSKTAAFTADVALHGQWIMPRDNSGSLAKKPPLVNWIGAPFYAAGLHAEWAIKAPSIFSALATVGVVFFIARRLFRVDIEGDARIGAGDGAFVAAAFAFAAGALWLASPVAVKNIYFLRPDMVLVALTTAGWAFATLAIGSPRQHDEDRQPSGLVRWSWLGMWVCTGLGVLAKGPAALLVPLYAILYATIIIRSRGAIQRTKWWLGVPIAAGIVAAWLIPAWLQFPEHMRETLLGEELLPRLQAGAASPEGTDGFLSRQLHALVQVPGWFFERFILGAGLFVLGVVMIGRRWRTLAIAPCALWTVMVLGVMIAFGAKGGSYQDPAYPQAAIVGAWAVLVLGRRWKEQRAPNAVPLMMILLLVAGGVVTRESLFSRGARTGSGDALKAFAQEVRQIVPRDASIAFVELGNHPLPTLLGHHPGDAGVEEQLSVSAWVIAPVREGNDPDAISGRLERVDMDGRGKDDDRQVLGLYRRDAFVPES